MGCGREGLRLWEGEKREDGISDPSRKTTITTTTMGEGGIPKYYFVNV
jgi:hypothetical protein